MMPLRLRYSVRPRNNESMNTINLHLVTMVVVCGFLSSHTPSPAVAWVVSHACVILVGSWSELPAVQQFIASLQFMALLYKLTPFKQHFPTI